MAEIVLALVVDGLRDANYDLMFSNVEPILDRRNPGTLG
jgi:hypothetical protein